VITRTGCLYRLQIPFKDDISSLLYTKSDARIDDIVKASEEMKKLSEEKDKSEMVLDQLKFLLRMEKPSGNPFCSLPFKPFYTGTLSFM
jgi:hypothetical protein